MPTTIDEEREYNDIINVFYSLLFLFAFCVIMCCCIYCIIKKSECEEKERERYNITDSEVI